MDPSNIITWAVCGGVAWLIFASLTGADEWLKSLLGNSQVCELEARIAKLEREFEEARRKLPVESPVSAC